MSFSKNDFFLAAGFGFGGSGSNDAALGEG